MTLNEPKYSYLLGFLQADGSFYETTRNRGRISLELQKCDQDICLKFSRLIPYKSKITTRKRTTNFSKNYESVVWTICDLSFRKILKSWGLPVGRKSEIICRPIGVSEVDYYRGLIDGDGSLGLTSSGIPFVSLVLSSEVLKDSYLSFLKKITGKQKTATRNKRDGVFNVVVYKEDAQLLARTLYYPRCLSLKRKWANAKRIMQWKRPTSMKKREIVKKWDKQQDSIVLTKSIKDAMLLLERTEKSIKSRKWRLTHAI